MNTLMNKPPAGTLILNSEDIASLLPLENYITIMEEAFTNYVNGNTYGVRMLHEASEQVEYHFKSGGIIQDGNSYYALKANSFSFRNAKEFDLPSIQGTIILFSGDFAFPLAILDSVVITTRRTGAAGAMAAKYLSRENSETVLVCGAGTQGGIQLEALTKVRQIKKAYVWDMIKAQREQYADLIGKRLGIEIIPVDSPSDVSRNVDIIITATPSTKALITKADVSAGTFIAAVGADSAHKQEMDPALVASVKLVTDITEQCVKVGDLHHAVEAGLMTADDIYGSIGEITAGLKPGRQSDDEIIMYDATGTALQDAAGAVACYKKAMESETGNLIALN